MAGIAVPPHAQPQDIGDPIPGGTEGQTLQDVLGNFKPLGNTQQAAGQPPAQAQQTLGQAVPSLNPNQPAPASQDSSDSSQDDGSGGDQSQDQSQPQQPAQQMNRSPAGVAPQMDPQAGAQKALADEKDNSVQADKVTAQLQSSIPKDQLQAAKEQQEDEFNAQWAKKNMAPPPIPENGAPAWVRFLGSLPKTNEGRLQVFQSHFGQDNARLNGDNFEFRDNDKAPWQSVSPQGIDFSQTQLMSNPSSFMDWAKGVDVAGHAGDILEGAGAGVLASGAAIAGAPAVLGAAGAFGIASLIRNGMNYDAGVQEAKDFSYQKDFMTSAGLGAVMQGATNLVNKTMIEPLKGILQSTTSNQMAAAAVIRDVVDDIHSALRLPDPEVASAMGLKSGQEVTEASTGKMMRSAIDNIHDQLSNRVGLVKTEALNGASEKGLTHFAIDNGLSNIKDVLGSRVIEDSTTGELKMATNIDGPMGDQVSSALKASQTAAWGDPSGTKVIQELVDKYNIYNASKSVNGGLPLRDLMDATSYFGDRSAFNEKSPLNDTILNNFKQIRNAFSTDQGPAISSSLEGSDMADMWKQDYQKYSDKIDLIGKFASQFGNASSAEKITQTLLSPGNSEPLQKISQIFGSSSPQMEGIRASWLSQRVSNAIDPVTGLFNHQSFIADISPKKWGPEMMDVLVQDETKMNELKYAASQAARINTAGFSMAQADQSAGAVVTLTSAITDHPTYAARSMFKLVRNNPQFADYMANDGINVAIRAANNDQAVQRVMQGWGIFESLVDNSRRVTVNGKKILVPVGKAALQMSAIGTKNAMVDNSGDDQAAPDQSQQ